MYKLVQIFFSEALRPNPIHKSPYIDFLNLPRSLAQGIYFLFTKIDATTMQIKADITEISVALSGYNM